MSQSTNPVVNTANQRSWVAKPIGKSANGATITDVSTTLSENQRPILNYTVEFDDDYREPERFYTIKFNGSTWICTTPRIPTICNTVLEWLESSVGDPTNLE